MKSAHRGAQEYTEGKRIREVHSPVRKRIGLISREHGSFQFRLPLTGSRKGLNWYLRVRKDQLGPHGPFPPRPAGPFIGALRGPGISGWTPQHSHTNRFRMETKAKP